MPGFLDQMIPKDLRSPVDQYIQIQAKQLATLESIERAIAQSTKDRPDPEPIWLSLPVLTSQRLRVIALIISTDTVGYYAVTVGTATVLELRLGANSPVSLGLDGLKNLHITEGLALSITGPVGAVWYATAIAIPE